MKTLEEHNKEHQTEPDICYDNESGEDCSEPARIKIEQDGLWFSSTLNDKEDWTILEAVLKRVRNRQNSTSSNDGK